MTSGVAWEAGTGRLLILGRSEKRQIARPDNSGLIAATAHCVSQWQGSIRGRRRRGLFAVVKPATVVKPKSYPALLNSGGECAPLTPLGKAKARHGRSSSRSRV